jgi:hypothetical protein
MEVRAVVSCCGRGRRSLPVLSTVLYKNGRPLPVDDSSTHLLSFLSLLLISELRCLVNPSPSASDATFS